MPSYKPIINGRLYSWGSIKCVILGAPSIGISEISYDESKESENIYAAGQQPVGFGDKNYVYDGSSFTCLIDEIKALENSAPDRNLLNIPPFSITVIMAGDGVVPTTEVLRNCRFTKRSFSSKSGDSSIPIKVDFTYAGLDKL